MARARTSSGLGWEQQSSTGGSDVRDERSHALDHGSVRPVTGADIKGFRDAADHFLSRADLVSDSGGPGVAERARQIVAGALRVESREQAAALAKRALSIDGDCVEAYMVLARCDTVFPGEVTERYRQAVAAGERSLGAELLEKHTGRFWALPETRPYMRALAGLAESLWCVGQPEESVRCYERMLRLNPRDNQGVRYLLMAYLLHIEKYEQAEALWQQFDPDPMAAWAYTRVWLDYRAGGDCDAARESLARAVEVNALVPEYLTGKQEMPKDLPGLYGIGNENEAILYTRDYQGVWRSCDGAIEWLAEFTGDGGADKG